MATNNFTAEFAENYEQKCLCVLVLDVSGSMNEIVDGSNAVSTGKTIYVDGKQYNVVTGGISKLDGLNDGLRSFYSEIANDETTSQRLELAVVTFNDEVNVIDGPCLVENSSLPILEADGETALVDAVYEAIGLVNARKNWYKSTNQPYYRPWIILMTDGEPNANQNIVGLSQQIKADTAAKKYVFLPIGVDNANMSVLQQLSDGKNPAMKLKGTNFGSFFKWLSASMGTVVNNEEGQKVDLSAGAGWMDAFVI